MFLLKTYPDLTHYWPALLWLIILFVHFVLNYFIYVEIGKEEFQGNQHIKFNSMDDFLAIFTFHWSKSYQEHESDQTVRWMKCSNIVSKLLIAYSVALFFGWIYVSYGKV